MLHFMNRKLFSRLIALSGISGVVILITSFIINSGPPPNPTLGEFIAFGKAHYDSIMLGAWAQAVSPPLIVIFALGVVYLSGDSQKFPGILTFFGAIILIIVSMIEITFYFSAVTGTPSTTGIISMELISAVQRLYSIIAAPMFFFTFSWVIKKGLVLPPVLGYIGFVLGSFFFVLGIIQLFYPIQYIVDYFSIAQGFWWLAGSIVLLIKSGKLSKSELI
jgi:hypothetical protein